MNELELARQRVADTQLSLSRERELHKIKPNQKMAEDTPDFVESYDFWCNDCDKDFIAPAYKFSLRLHGEWLITYVAVCECGRECVRLLSHRDLDPYYYLSEKIQENRNLYANDVIRHDQYGFETHYGRPFKQREDEERAREERRLAAERDKGFKLSRL